MSNEHFKALRNKSGRQGAARALRTLADQVEAGDITAVAWTFIWGNPQKFGSVNGGMACSAGLNKTAYDELGQLVAIDCEEHGWKTPWGEQ